MKYEYNSKFKIGDNVYYIGLELKEIVIIPCIIESVCFTNSGLKYYVDKIDDEITENEIVDIGDTTEIIRIIQDLAEELW